MNTRIKNRYHYAFVHWLIAAFLLFASPQLHADNRDNCQKWTGNVQGQLQSALGPTAGIVEVLLEDGQFFPMQVKGTINDIKVDKRGVIHLKITTAYDVGEGSRAIGIDKATATPTEIPGEYDFNIRVKIFGVSGLFTGVTGNYHGKGRMSFNELTIQHSGGGKICTGKV